MNDITRKGTGSMLRLTTSQSKGKAKYRGGGGTTYNCLHGEAPPKRGIFFRPQVYERGGISLVEVYKKEGKFVFRSVNRAKRADRRIYGCEKKCFVLFSFSYLKDTAFTAVKRQRERPKVPMCSLYHFSMEGMRKAYLFWQKWHIDM